jgi:hypothetical protein
MLVPLQSLPSIELLSSSARAIRRQAASTGECRFPAQRSEHIEWRISLTLLTRQNPSQIHFRISEVAVFCGGGLQ